MCLLRVIGFVGCHRMSMLGRAFWAMLGFVREPDYNREEE